MSFIQPAGSFLSQIVNFIANPFRYLGGYQLLQPFRQIGYYSRYVMTNINIMPQLRYYGSYFSGVAGKTGMQVPGLSNIGESFSTWMEEREYEEIEREYNLYAEKGDYSQIHIVNQTTGERTVVHIGASIGKPTNEVVVPRIGRDPVRFRFGQVDKQRYGAPILLEYVDGASRITIDGLEVKQYSPITHNAEIRIDNEMYRCELFAWDKLPPVARVNAGWFTSTGPVRPYNEDAVGIFQHARGYLFCVADGVGGGEAGELISEFAVQYLLATFNANIRYNLDWSEIYRQALDNINAAVRKFARTSDFPTAGSTLTAIVIKGWDAHIYHVGDSRLYHYNNGQIKQVTTDHSIIKEIADTRKNPDGSDRRPIRRTVLSKAIGKADTISGDYVQIRLQPGDKFILSSDGLNERVKLDELAQLLSEYPANTLPEKLAELANERYNSDNISIIALDVVAAMGRDVWRAAPAKRVYANYDRTWTLRLRALPKPTTNYNYWRRGRVLRVLLLLIVFVLAVHIGWNNIVLPIVAENAARQAAIQQGLNQSTTTTTTNTTTTTLGDDSSSTGIIFNADGTPITTTPLATTTPRPTRTPAPTFTPLPTDTPVPTEAPTSTLAPIPTSTLAGA
jgi:serine/threonine protein phosphatase PrpC